MLLNNSQSKGHLPSVDILRSVAVLSVMLFHYAREPFKDWSTFHSIALHGHNGVPLFFFISGFIVPYSMYGGGFRLGQIHRFLAKRFTRIEIPYFASIVFLIAWEKTHNYIEYPWMPITVDWAQLLSHVGYVYDIFGYPKYQEVYWTLGIEFQFYLFLALCAPLLWSQKKYLNFIPLILLAASAVFIYTPYNTAICQYGFLFISGMLFFQFRAGIIKPLLFAVLMLATLVGIYYKSDNHASGVGQIVMVLFGMLVIAFLNKDWLFFRFIGKISFSLYLTHMIIEDWGSLTAMGIFGIDIQTKLYLSINFFVAIIVGALFYYIVERPAMKLASRFRYNSQS